MPEDDMPRVDELFSRAVVAQLAEQRAQRETYAELERKLEAVERLVTERLSELSKLLRGGEVQMRLDILEETLSGRITGLEQSLHSGSDGRLEDIANRLSRLEESVRSEERNQALITLETTMKRRLGQLEDAVRVDDTSRRLSALEAAINERFGQLEGSVQTEQLGALFDGLDHSMDERLSQLEEAVRRQDLARRLDTLEHVMEERLGHLEESVRAEEIGPRLKAIELAMEDRSHRLSEEPVRSEGLEERLEALDEILRERLKKLDEVSGVGRLDALDQSVGYRLTRLEGSLRRLEEHTSSRLEDLKEASQAAEAGILERIIVESQVVGAHFQAVRPVVEAVAESRPELQEALAEVRELVEASRSAERLGAEPMIDTGPFPADALKPPSDKDEADTVFLAPEETPIPDRRFGGIRPRREKAPPGV